MAAKRRRKSGKAKGLKSLGRAAAAALEIFWKIFPILLVVALTGALFLGVRSALYADPNLAIDRLVVEPAQSISIAERQVLESALVGKNILTVDLNKVARGLEKNPGIQEARITRRFPSELRIDITTRKAAAFIQFSPRGSVGLVSEDGVVLDVLGRPNAALVLVEAFGLGIEQPQVGLQWRNRGFQEAMKFLNAYWDSPFAREEAVTKMILDHLGNVTIQLGAGPAVRLGRRPAGRLSSLDKIRPLLKGDARNKIDYIDLQFDDVIVKRKR